MFNAMEGKLNTCRICKKQEETRYYLFKYGTRHYAHGRCGLLYFGAKFLDMIPSFEIGRLPAQALQDAGLLDEARHRAGV